jgi:hypothetical protein
VQCANIISVGKWKDTGNDGGDTLVEKDIEQKGGKNAALKYTSLNVNNKVARR